MEVIDRPASAVAEYQPFYAQLAELEANNAALTFDYESKKGNKEARSHVNTLRLTKGALERTRKEAKEESLKIGRAVDSEAKEIAARIEAMIKVHQDAIDAIEQREKVRIAGHVQSLANLRNTGVASTVAEIVEAIAYLEPLVIGDDWEEFKPQALEVKDAALRELRQRHGEAVEREKQEAELARLRQEAADRAQKDRDDAIAKAAAERAQAEAAAAATRAAAAAAQAIAEAEAKAKADREAGERRELELKLQAENAERRRVEQEQRAEQDRKDAIERAEKQAAEAVEREQKRVAAVAAQEAKDLAAREANKAHKTRVNRAALAALVAGGLSEECAKQCVTLIASGKVPAISIEY